MGRFKDSLKKIIINGGFEEGSMLDDEKCKVIA
jgi:hypothetical protein